MPVANDRLVRPAWASRALLAVVPLVAAALPAKAGGAYMPLYTFTGGADGAFPYASVTLDTAGNIYGETDGGADLCPVFSPGMPNYGCGTVYKLAPTGQLTTLVSFAGPNGAVGMGQLALAGGVLFGSAGLGGAANVGVIFSVNTDGSNFQLIHQFSGKDGSYPNGPLIAKEKLLYGVTLYGGPHAYQRNGDNGTLFEIHQNGSFTLLHAFNGHDGQYPNVIIMDASGTIFGSTHAGGTSNCYCGTIFSYVPSTKTFTTLYAFNNTSDGEFPALGSVGPDGTLYGVGTNGGRGEGTLFDLVPSGAGYMFHTLYKFALGRGAAGSGGSSGPTLLPNGALFGADFSALYYFSTAFPKGVNPHTFSVSGPASQPVPGPGPSPSLYGTTVSSSFDPCLSSTGVTIGNGGCGMIYRESLGTPAP